MSGALTTKGVTRHLPKISIRIIPPSHSTVAGQLCVADGGLHSIGTDQLLAIPITVMKHEPRDAGRGIGAIAAASPTGNQRQSVNNFGLPIST